MPIPDYQTLMKPVLLLSQEEQKFADSVETIAADFSLTPEECSEKLPSGTNTVIRNRVAWAITYLNQAGLVERRKRGFYSITDEGREVVTENPERVDVNYLKRFQSFLDFRNRRRKGDSNSETVSSDANDNLTPSETVDSAYLELRKAVESELLERILQQTPSFFETLVIDLFKKMGFGEFRAEATGGSGDGGIDGVIHQDSLGLDIVYIQAKRYDPKSNPIGRPELQKFVGALSGKAASKGIFITTSTFSSHVESYLETVNNRVRVIDGAEMVQLMIDHGVGVREEKTYTLHRIDEDFFNH